MDETNQTAEGASIEPTPMPPDPPEPAQGQKDWKAESRKWESRAKENKEKADKYDELQKASQTDSKKAEEAEKRAVEAEQNSEKAKAELERMQMLVKVSEETNVPASLIRGNTEEEMRKHAQSIVDFKVKSKPSIPSDQGGSAGKPVVTKESIESIKDPIARVNARAKNLNLYQ